VAAFTAFVGVWAFAFWYDATRPSPEPLDPGSLRAATLVCESAITSLSKLAPVSATPTVSERAARVKREDAAFASLVIRLDRIRPANHDGATALWLFAADWRHLTASRERYAGALLSGAKSPKLVIPVDPMKKPVTIRMREYAEIHKLVACTPNSLQGEVVEGPRTYPRVP
jgi:hypothetical protein